MTRFVLKNSCIFKNVFYKYKFLMVLRWLFLFNKILFFYLYLLGSYGYDYVNYNILINICLKM